MRARSFSGNPPLPAAAPRFSCPPPPRRPTRTADALLRAGWPPVESADERRAGDRGAQGPRGGLKWRRAPPPIHRHLAASQRACSHYVDKTLYDEAADLFARDGRLEIAGRGLFIGQERVRRTCKLPQLGTACCSTTCSCNRHHARAGRQRAPRMLARLSPDHLDRPRGALGRRHV
jgi:hypothetical protein